MNQSTFSQLSAEHHCLLALAEDLREQAAALPGAPSDLQTILDQAVRLRELFTRSHGPKDEAVVAKALEGDDGLRSMMTPLLHLDAKHFQGSLLSVETALHAAVFGQVVPTQTIVDRAEEAVQYLRAQIQMEESATYPWAYRCLGPHAHTDLAHEIALIGERWPHDPCADPAPTGV